MFNSYGWIKLGMNRKHLDLMDEALQAKYDELDRELVNKVKVRLQEIIDGNESIRIDFIDAMNNLENFLSIQLSRNHFSETVRELFKWISELSDGSHGVLYEMNDEDEQFNPNCPYRVWRLIGNEFEEYQEVIINEKYHKIHH